MAIVGSILEFFLICLCSNMPLLIAVVIWNKRTDNKVDKIHIIINMEKVSFQKYRKISGLGKRNFAFHGKLT